MKALLAVAAVGAMLVGIGIGGGWGQPEPKAKPEGAVVTEGKGLDKLAFLKGTWSGKVGDDWVEETWSAPHGDSIIGMFRWQSGGKTTMWEMLSIKEEEGKAVLRLRHFDGKFDPWKNEMGPVEAMPASEVSAGRALFVGAPDGKGGLKNVEYKVQGDTLEITVRFRDETRAALEFDLKRQ